MGRGALGPEWARLCLVGVLTPAALLLSQVKRAIEKGNLEGARIYAQNAIRKKTEQLNYLKARARQ